MTQSAIWPCVLTATFRPAAGTATALIDESVRMTHYAEALRWAAQTATARGGLVLAENSGVRSPLVETSIDDLRTERYPVEYHDLSEAPTERFKGKGWGEGRMIEKLASQSPLLAAHDSFTKITGRLRLVNHRRIARIIQNLRTRVPNLAFVAQSFTTDGSDHTGTQFFWTRRDFYNRYLADAYRQSDDNAGIYLEHALGARLRELAPHHAIYVFRLPVIINGINGWNAQVVQARHFQWRLRLHDLLQRRGPAAVPLTSLLT